MKLSKYSFIKISLFQKYSIQISEVNTEVMITRHEYLNFRYSSHIPKKVHPGKMEYKNLFMGNSNKN
jgi:hypothetical protein